MKTSVSSLALWAVFVVVLIAPFFAFADPTVTIQSISPSSSVISGTTITFTAVSTGISSPSYSVRDSFTGSSIGVGNIGATNGIFNWMPVYTDIGTHTLTITAADSTTTSASVTQNITVSLIANVSIQSITPGTSVDPGQTLRFNAVTAGFSATSTTYSVTDSFAGSTLRSSNINSSGNFSWTPSSSDSGSHKITVLAADKEGNSSSASATITVTGTAAASSASTTATVILTSPIPTGNIAPGATVTFSALAFGFSSPVFRVSDSFSGTSIAAGNISSSGNVSWTPRTSDLGTHNLTVSVSDSAGHSAVGTVQIVVAGAAVAPAYSVPSTPVTVAAAPQVSNYFFTSNLKFGMTSDEVTQLQKILASQGHLTASATGYFGPATEKALKNFQTANGLTALGIVGPQTRTLLNQLSGTASASVPSVQVSSQVAGAGTAQTVAVIEAKIALIQAQVKILQEQLAALLLEVAKLK